MPTNDEALKRFIVDCLSSKGLNVEDIPRSETEKRPDLVVESGTSDEILIELKQKQDNQAEIEAYHRAMAEKPLEVVGRIKSTDSRNRIDGLIQKGVQQLTAYDSDHSSLHALWMHCEGHDANLHAIQIEATAYGIEKLISENHEGLITCYYFHNSAFYRYRNELDIIIRTIIIDESSDSVSVHLLIMLNDHSPKFNAVKNSKLAITFDKSLFAPSQGQIKDHIMIFDHPNTPSPSKLSENAILACLRSKYELEHLQIMPMAMHEAGIAYFR